MKISFIVTSNSNHTSAGDFFTALEFGTALEKHYLCSVEYIQSSTEIELPETDIVIVMLHDFNLRSIKRFRANLIKVAWARNWFERWVMSPWFNEFDICFASSRSACRFMSEKTNRLVKLLRIATNIDRFNNHDRLSNMKWDVIFTGSNWQSSRDISQALPPLAQKYRVAVFGKSWEDVPEMSPLSHGFVPYSNLADIYKSSSIVIDDANHVTKQWGAANSRIFDALAAGCMVISNSCSVSNEVFSGLLPVYSDAASLSELVDSFLENYAVRDQLIDSLRRIILSEHLYKHRAIQIGLYLPQLPRR